MSNTDAKKSLIPPVQLSSLSLLQLAERWGCDSDAAEDAVRTGTLSAYLQLNNARALLPGVLKEAQVKAAMRNKSLSYEDVDRLPHIDLSPGLYRLPQESVDFVLCKGRQSGVVTVTVIIDDGGTCGQVKWDSNRRGAEEIRVKVDDVAASESTQRPPGTPVARTPRNGAERNVLQALARVAVAENPQIRISDFFKRPAIIEECKLLGSFQRATLEDWVRDLFKNKSGGRPKNP